MISHTHRLLWFVVEVRAGIAGQSLHKGCEWERDPEKLLCECVKVEPRIQKRPSAI